MKKGPALAQLRSDSALADFPGRLQELAQRLDGGEFSLARHVPAVAGPRARAVAPLRPALRRL